MILLSLLMFVLGGASVFAYFTFLKPEKVAPQPTVSPTVFPVASPTPSPSPDITVGWETYKNERHEYILRYPSNFLIEELEKNICPPETGGCREVKEKGDQVRVYNERSEFFINIDDGFPYPSLGSSCLEKVGSISEIVIDGEVLYEIKSATTGGFLYVVSRYEERKLGEKQIFCPEYTWLHKGKKIRINTYIQGVGQEDNQLVRQILGTLIF